MRFSCKTRDVLRAIGIVGRAISSQQAMPILNNILFRVEGKRCIFSATNLEFSIISSIEADVENEGSITIPAKAIQNFAQYSTDDEVVFESSEDAQMKCQSKKSRTIIAGEPASEYPTITPIQKEVQITVSQNELLQAIHHVGFASARTTTRPVLSGVYCKVVKNDLCLAATDSYRLSEYKIPLISSSGMVECIIPAKVLIEMLSILGGFQRKHDENSTTEKESKKNTEESDPQITITLSSQQIEVVVEQTTILSRLIDGTFPDYQQILPITHTTKVFLPLAEFLTDVKRMHYFAKESNNNLTITISSTDVVLQTQTTQIGRDESKITADINGEKNKIALSSSYLLDFLSRVSGEKIEIQLIDKMHPALFRIPNLPNYLHLIMPLRLQEEV